MSKVSVALATFNGEKYILKQLRSLLFQGRTIDEVIICDDASSDNTVNIIKDFIEQNRLSNWHLHVNSENIGFLKNFKKAIENTTGDIIFLCDQDDIWNKTKVGAMVNRFESDERIKAIYSGFKFIDENDNIIRIHKKIMHSNNNLIKLRIEPFETVKIDFLTISSHNISPGCTLAFTREVKDIYLSKTKSICVHDWELALIASFLDGLYFFNTPLTNYRLHSKNTIGLSELVSIRNRIQTNRHNICLNKAKEINSCLQALDVYHDLLDEDKMQILNKRCEFASMRLDALNKKDTLKICKLYKHNNSNYKAITFKRILADIFCIFRK